MKDSKTACPKPPPPPKPNLKNKDFVKWQKAESCRKDDNIISTDWHERLQRIGPFIPVYNNAPLNMTYLLSGEYGRIWQKERDEWYSGVFVPKGREKEMDDRKKKIRREIRAAKKAAEISIKERKERKAKEAELKAKAEAERLEKLKAKLQKCAAKKPQKQKSTKKQKQEQKPKTEEPSESGQGTCPKDWTQVELTVQCECSDHKNETPDTQENKGEQEPAKKSESTSPTMCKDYIQQLKDIHEAKDKEALGGHKTEVDPSGNADLNQDSCGGGEQTAAA